MWAYAPSGAWSRPPPRGGESGVRGRSTRTGTSQRPESARSGSKSSAPPQSDGSRFTLSSSCSSYSSFGGFHRLGLAVSLQRSKVAAEDALQKMHREAALRPPASDPRSPQTRRQAHHMKTQQLDDVDLARSAVSSTGDIVAAKCTPLLIHERGGGTRRFRELERVCGGMSTRTRADRLRTLEQAGVVARHSYPESPPRVEYQLTEKGRALLPIIREMRKFG